MRRRALRLHILHHLLESRHLVLERLDKRRTGRDRLVPPLDVGVRPVCEVLGATVLLRQLTTLCLGGRQGVSMKREDARRAPS